MIELHDVTRTFGRKIAVNQLTLSVPRGELFAFLGENGAGKTTTIKMLVGLLRPNSGIVRVCGLNVFDADRAASRLMAYVPDEPHLYDKLSGREFLRFIAGMYGMSDAEARRRADEQIERLELNEYVDELCESYSHGTKQRLVIGAAMLHDPAVMVVDEPMVGLDPRSARVVKDLFRARAKAGATIFMSTHTLALAEEIADRIGIIAHGRLRCVGTLDELRRDHGGGGAASLEEVFLRVTRDRPAVGDGKSASAEPVGAEPASP
ncbi:MAG: ABC transporter ATP-binding protein [Planctomycetes bacterium]|nr:ABC transporter ATP-binding protein [Planctomycetota bacterium]